MAKDDELLKGGTVGIAAVAALLKCSVGQVETCVKMGMLKAVKTPQGLRFAAADIDAAVANKALLETLQKASPDITGKMTLGGCRYVTSKFDSECKGNINTRR